MKKLISALLAVMFVFSVLPINAYAEPASVKAIEYTPSSPIVCYYDSDDGYWTTDNNGDDYFYCYVNVRGTGDVLTVIDDSDNRTDYVCKYNEAGDYYYYEAQNGDIIPVDDVTMSGDGQETNHYVVGGDSNFMQVTYQGKTANVPVSLIVNPLKSISFTPVSQRFVVENMGGKWETDASGNTFYNYNAPWFEEGDVLTVIASDGTETKYTYKYDSFGDLAFYDSLGNALPDRNDLFVSKSVEPWYVGKTYTYYVGYKSERAPVSIIVLQCTNPGGHTWNKGVVTKKATYTATGVKTFTCTSCGRTKTEAIPKLSKKANPMTLKAKTLKLKAGDLKNASVSKAIKYGVTIKSAKGKLTYKKKSGNAKITINKKTGKITVKNGLKKGVYKVKVAIKAAGNDMYKPVTKTVTFKVKVS